MEGFRILLIISLVFMAAAAVLFIKVFSRFNKLKEGDVLSTELAAEFNKQLKIAIALSIVACVLGVTGVLIRYI